jgi:hypothetical protein
MKVGLPSVLTAAEAQPFFFRPFLLRSFNFVDNVPERLWAISKDSRLLFVFRQLALEYFPSLTQVLAFDLQRCYLRDPGIEMKFINTDFNTQESAIHLR